MAEASTFQDEAAIRARQMAEIREDSAKRFECQVQRLVEMEHDWERRAHLERMAQHHHPDLIERLRRAAWVRLHPQSAASAS